eukprot:GFKZ01010705.1.p1 GENE.GFKZ01010705.1~~GFKZ01010705.1.p1  ORF type:complete len:372 (+),score=39.86 GFKZ01010705.1:121-1236(+)
MKIVKITVYQKKLVLSEPYYLSGGRLKFGELDSTIISIQTDAGIEGWGEGCPWGVSYLPAFAKGIRAGLEELAPALLGENPLHLDKINHKMDVTLPGHGYIKSALDMACWDILGKHARLPVYALLGGKFQDSIQLQGSISTSSPEKMKNNIAMFRKEGYKFFTGKIGGDVDTDLKRIRTILNAIEPGESVTFDVNRAWLPGEAIQVMNSVSECKVYFEQPCETIEEMRQVRALTTHPMIVDESVQSLEDLSVAYTYNLTQAIGLKVGRVGGLTKARRMKDFCVWHGIQMNTEDTGGSQIADTAAVHLAISTPAPYHRATWDCCQLHHAVTARGGYTRHGGRAFVGDGHGLGISPVVEALGAPLKMYWLDPH